MKAQHVTFIRAVGKKNMSVKMSNQVLFLRFHDFILVSQPVLERHEINCNIKIQGLT